MQDEKKPIQISYRELLEKKKAIERRKRKERGDPDPPPLRYPQMGETFELDHRPKDLQTIEECLKELELPPDFEGWIPINMGMAYVRAPDPNRKQNYYIELHPGTPEYEAAQERFKNLPSPDSTHEKTYEEIEADKAREARAKCIIDGLNEIIGY